MLNVYECDYIVNIELDSFSVSDGGHEFGEIARMPGDEVCDNCL